MYTYKEAKIDRLKNGFYIYTHKQQPGIYITEHKWNDWNGDNRKAKHT